MTEQNRRKKSLVGGVSVGDIKNNGGQVNVAGGDIEQTIHTMSTGYNAKEVEELFEKIYLQISARPNTSDVDKKDLVVDVKEIQNELAKQDKADESFLAKRLRNIKRIAPDIYEVAVATIANPIAGLGIIAKKVAEKMRAEALG